MQTNIREAAIYSIADAARYTGVPVATLRSWLVGRPYQAAGATRWSNSVLTKPPAAHRERLSFNNLTEAHILSALRRIHRVKLATIRKAVLYIKQHYHTAHPLLHPDLMTDGAHLFIDEIERIVCASEHGQLTIREVIRVYLTRFDLDANGIPRQFYPFTSKRSEDCPRLIVLNPAVMAGCPVIVGTRITAACINERFLAGESKTDLASDYDQPIEAIEEAICLQRLNAA